MEPMQDEVISALEKEDWVLALEVLRTISSFSDQRDRFERNYDVSVFDLQSIAFLPGAKFKKLKRDAVTLVIDGLHKINDELYQKLCRDFNYCDRQDIPLARLISYLIGVLDVIYGNGAIALAVLIAKKEYLDKVCNCPK